MNDEDTMERVVEDASRRIADAISPSHSLPYIDGDAKVDSLVESVVYLAQMSREIAQGLHDVADAIRETKE